jgi:pyroglutamyl-peptidase
VRLLVTGFGSFPGVDENPTAALVRSLPRTIDGNRVHRLVLPVSWGRTEPCLRRRVVALRPDIVLLTGVANQAAPGRLESGAINWQDGRPDADRQSFPARPIDARRPKSTRVLCAWPVAELCRQLSASGLVASDNAGSYLCNRSLFCALELDPPEGAGFVHLASGVYRGVSDPRRQLLVSLIADLIASTRKRPLTEPEPIYASVLQ